MKSKNKRKIVFAKRGAKDLEEATAWLASQNIEEIECMVPDLAGVARGKIMPSK
jgi:glutamine synthetase